MKLSSSTRRIKALHASLHGRGRRKHAWASTGRHGVRSMASELPEGCPGHESLSLSIRTWLSMNFMPFGQAPESEEKRRHVIEQTLKVIKLLQVAMPEVGLEPTTYG
jgi:hypothetical protein